MRSLRITVLSTFLASMAVAALPGCSGQDPGQPPIGSISAEDRSDLSVPGKKADSPKK